MNILTIWLNCVPIISFARANGFLFILIAYLFYVNHIFLRVDLIFCLLTSYYLKFVIQRNSQVSCQDSGIFRETSYFYVKI